MNRELKKTTIDEALREVLKPWDHKLLGTNAAVIGEASRYVRCSFRENNTAGKWVYLAVQLFAKDDSQTTYLLRLNPAESQPPNDEWNNPNYEQGGYLWQSGNGIEWYNWKPRFRKLRDELTAILDFHLVPYLSLHEVNQ
jgi:hypothetical protein